MFVPPVPSLRDSGGERGDLRARPACLRVVLIRRLFLNLILNRVFNFTLRESSV
jgi:hypothetical protein